MALNGVTLNFGSSSNPLLGDIIVATVSPQGENVTYQWYNASSTSGPWSEITGATNSSYQVQYNDVAKYIKCVVTSVSDTTDTEEARTGSVSNRVALKATAISQTEIELTWYDTGTVVDLQRKAGAGAYSALATGIGGGKYIDSTPVSGTKYNYKLVMSGGSPIDFSAPTDSCWVLHPHDHIVTAQKASTTFGNSPIVLARIEDSDLPISNDSVNVVSYQIYSVAVQALGQMKTRTEVTEGAVQIYNSASAQSTPVITANLIKDANWTMDDKGYNFIAQLGTIETSGAYEAKIIVTPASGYGNQYAFVIPIVVE